MESRHDGWFASHGFSIDAPMASREMLHLRPARSKEKTRTRLSYNFFFGWNRYACCLTKSYRVIWPSSSFFISPSIILCFGCSSTFDGFRIFKYVMFCTSSKASTKEKNVRVRMVKYAIELTMKCLARICCSYEGNIIDRPHFGRKRTIVGYIISVDVIRKL